jgi:hypothetical protein
MAASKHSQIMMILTNDARENIFYLLSQNVCLHCHKVYWIKGYRFPSRMVITVDLYIQQYNTRQVFCKRGETLIFHFTHPYFSLTRTLSLLLRPKRLRYQANSGSGDF